jgi:peptide/nickel transport system substrate-binding protein
MPFATGDQPHYQIHQRHTVIGISFGRAWRTGTRSPTCAWTTIVRNVLSAPFAIVSGLGKGFSTMISRYSFFAVSLVVAGAAVVGCTSTASNSPDSVVISVYPEPKALNPVLGFAPYGASKLFDGLVTLDKDLNLVPALAKSLPAVSDGDRTFTYRLRDGVTFSDGTRLTSEDVAFTYRAILDPATNTTMRTDMAAIDTIDTPDPSTVVFHLKHPFAAFPQYTGVGILPAHLLRGKNINTDQFNRKPIGSGPYVLSSWVAGEKLVLTANPHYWGGVPKVHTVTLTFVEDDNVRASRLTTGEFDAASIPPQLADRFRHTTGMTVRTVPSADFRGVMMPMDNPVTADRALRLALDQAVDRAAMVRGILGGVGRAAFGPLLPGSQWYEPAIEHPVDLARANRVLDEAGWVTGPDGIRERAGQKAQFTVMYSAGDAIRKDIALAFASDARKIGIDVKPAGLATEAMTYRMRYDAVVMGWGTPYDPDFINYKIFHSSYAGKGWFNAGHYHNPVVDQLLDRGRTTSDRAERVEIYRDLQRALAADPAWIYCVGLDHMYAMADRWAGIQQQVEPYNDGLAHGPWWNLEKWQPRP